MKRIKAKGTEFVLKNVSGRECIEGYLEYAKKQLKEYVDQWKKDNKVKDIIKWNMLLAFKYLEEKMGL